MDYTHVDIARVCHEANRALQLANGEPDISPHWHGAPDWQKASAVEGVTNALNGASPEGLHDQWCESKLADGWMYGPVKDGERKTHPCLVGYDSLPESQKRKDALFYAIVEALR